MILRYFLVSLIFLVGCQSSEWDLSRRERAALERVFHDVMLEESGIYTLWGEKPMTCFAVAENLTVRGMRIGRLSLKDWKLFEQVEKRHPFNRFNFVLIPHEPIPGVSEWFDAYFVNISETAAVLRKHYDLFRKKVGFDFSPMNTVMEMKIPDSKFWNIVLKDSYLTGILLGFGEHNARCFEEWVVRTEREPIQYDQDDFSDSDEQQSTIEALSLPIFRMFASPENDAVLAKYRKQREEIQERYKGQDFVDQTLAELTYY